MSSVSETSKMVQEMNERHAIVQINGKKLVADVRAGIEVSYGSLSDIEHFYANRPILTGEKSSVSRVKAWLDHPCHNSYPNGVNFCPNTDIEGTLNLWQGFDVVPDPNASCDHILDHIENILCCGNPTLYRYLIGWLAHMVQKPEERPDIAIVFRGRSGAGKDVLGRYLSYILGSHYISMGLERYLNRKFNNLFEGRLLFHIEDVHYLTERNFVGACEETRCADRLLIKRKYVGEYSLNNCSRLLMSCSEDWNIPANVQEQKYLILDISDARKHDQVYFGQLVHEMRNQNGPAALLHYLQSVDLNGFDVLAAPTGTGPEKSVS